MHSIYGARWTNEALVALTDAEGVILYYRDDEARTPKSEDSILVGSDEVTWPKGWSLTPYYEASSGMIIELWRSRLGFRPLEN